MELQQLLQAVTEVRVDNDILIKGLALHSKQVQQGYLFLALKPAHPYIKEAIDLGASAVIAEAKEGDLLEYHSSNIPIIYTKNLATKLEVLASRFYGDPQKNFEEMIGVTGTNGKTTICYVLAQALSRLAKPCAYIGTLGVGFIHSLVDSGYTTPDPIALQKYLSLLANKAKALAMEVTSQGLTQNRVNQIPFNSAHFTNLTQDHLDYHLTMQAYGKAKEKLFQFPSLQRAVVNGDSPYSQKILQVLAQDIPVAIYSLQEQIQGIREKAQQYRITTSEITLDHKGIRAFVKTPWGEGLLRSTLLGKFNLSNLLSVLAELCLQAYDFKHCLEVLAQVHAPPGRMQKLGGVHTPQVIIDYAHTPDALENALEAARLHCTRRLWCVFGCGGNRDKEKRSKMGNIAAKLADKVVITSDNPRSENPNQIIEDILEGLNAAWSEKVIVQENRESAIAYAIKQALAVDTILIAGKGHENYQIIGDNVFPFSDTECVKKNFNMNTQSERGNLKL